MRDDTSEADSAGAAPAGSSWHIQIFETRKSVTRLLGGRKRVSTGFGWSGSGNPEGYEYDPGPYKTREAATAAARKTLAALGGTIADVSESNVPIDLEA